MNKAIKDKVEVFRRVLNEVPELRYVGDSILRKETNTTTLEDGIAISKRLEDILLKYRNITGVGRGLAAPQIGESKSVFVTYINDEIEVFINPKIVESSSGTNFYKELCMSTGIISADVERPVWIKMEWTDSGGERHSEKFEGFKARLLQHEQAHLEGVLSVDEVAPGGIEIMTTDPLKEELRNER